MFLRIKDFFLLARPKQWIKGFFVLAGAVFSGRIFDPATWPVLIAAFSAFCLLSSGIYVVNDLADCERDRLHPKKASRPIASGRVGKTQAAVYALILFSLSATAGAFVGWQFMAVQGIFIVNSLLYTFLFKNVVIVDVISIAVNFLLRVLAGGVAADVEMSVWILLCTFQLALFLGFSKRRSELMLLNDDAHAHRLILKDYTVPFCDSLVQIMTVTAIVFYTMYTFMERPPITMVTAIFVIYGMCRYLYLIYVKNRTDSIEEILISDFPLALSIILWVVSSALLLYIPGV